MLSKTVNEMMAQAGFKGYYTNHSLLVSSATRLFDAEVDEQLIRESVDSLCRDGSDTHIVCVHTYVHRKVFLTREHSHSKPFWAPSYSIPVVLYPTIPPK